MCSTVKGNQILALLLLFLYSDTDKEIEEQDKVTAVDDSGLKKKMVAEAQFSHQISNTVSYCLSFLVISNQDFVGILLL